MLHKFIVGCKLELTTNIPLYFDRGLPDQPEVFDLLLHEETEVRNLSLQFVAVTLSLL
jgi:hypothetical protein